LDALPTLAIVAQQASPAPAPEGPPPGDFLASPLVFLGLMLVMFYFLLFRPQAKQAKQQRQFLDGLKVGQKVITASGIVGVVHRVDERFIQLEVASNVRLKILRTQVQGAAPEDKEPEDPGASKRKS
jgi:preprotein translocase subunit YajC